LSLLFIKKKIYLKNIFIENNGGKECFTGKRKFLKKKISDLTTST